MRPIRSKYEIEPCPFCGYPGELFHIGADCYSFIIRCLNGMCKAEQTVYGTEEEAVKR